MQQASPSQQADQAAFAEIMRTAGYEVQERIGGGETAEVFRACQSRFGRQVAVTIVRPELAADPVIRKRFIKDSLAAAALGHDHIVPIYDVGEVRGVLYVALRDVRAGDVGSLVRRLAEDDERLPVRRVVAIVAQMASALDAAHAGHLVHGDVRSANMLLEAGCQGGRVGPAADHACLSGFGLSEVSLQHARQQPGGVQFNGTVGYASPEQLAGKPVDGRAGRARIARPPALRSCREPQDPRETASQEGAINGHHQRLET